MQNLLGLVLCGGESKRMGSDKGLLQIEDTIWALFMADKLKPFHIPVVFSVNAKQIENYEQYISKEKLIVDSVAVGGPLRGLLSVHKMFPENDLLMLSCDMLDLDSSSIQTIIQFYREQKEYDLFVYQDIEYAQPFCGIYTSQGLKKELAKAEQHLITKFSLQKMLDEGQTKRIPIKNEAAFKNYNFKE